MADVRLYDSTICRLCAEDNDNGEMLFTDDSEETELSAMVNRYLPLKIHDDGKLPRTICPGCNIQLEATVEFFQLLINGQQKIRQLWKEQLKLERQTEKMYLEHKSIDIPLFNDTELIKENFVIGANDQQLVFNIIPEASVYGAKHDLSLQMEGLHKSKKKRGRPPKCFSEDVEKDIRNEKTSQEEYKRDEEELDGDKRGRRKIKVPKRYMETIQGKELEKVLKEEGVFDEKTRLKCEPFGNLDNFQADSFNSDTDVIGHLITPNGKNLNEPVTNKNRNRVNQQKSKTSKKRHKFTCSFCGKDFLQRSKYIIHKSLHKAIIFECFDCQNQFSNKEDLLLHQKATGHNGEKLVEENETPQNSQCDLIKESNAVESENNIAVITMDCPTDNPSFLFIKEDHELNDIDTEQQNTEYESIEELNSKTDVFRCDKCNKHFDTKNNLDTHVKVVHQGEKPYVCELCNKAFAYQTSLQGHIEIEHSVNSDKGFPCDICGKILNHPSSITYHKLTEHNDGRLYECNKCTKRFKHKQLLQRHQIVHSEDRPYPCGSCTASFKTKANLLNHQSTHTGEKKHCCELCNMKFAHKTSLTLHYRTHTGQKPYKCEVCTKSFSQNGNLQEHMRIHTGEKPYCCDHCGRKFTTSSQFKLHVKRHTGERPWKCDYCPKSFLHKDTWKCHVRRHTGERPFECEHCQRKFTEQWALKKHLRLHTGEKPYRCEFCGKAFADCSNLTKHKKVHKNQQTREPNETVNSAGTENNLWPISRDSIEENMINVSPEHEISEGDTSRNIYLTYPNPSNPTESVTLKISKDNLIADESSSSDEMENDNVDGTDDNNFQLSILDTDGNPIRLSVEQARQLLSDGHFLNQTSNDTNQAQILSAVLQNNIKVDNSSDTDQDGAIPKVQIGSALQSDAEAIVKMLQNETTDATTASINQINTEEQVELSDQQVFQLIIPDGQKLQLLKVDPLQLSSGLLTIV
ncbi:zinc finger protein 184 [Copidosoma floridanum]|uniref:zinc finger protein 184 n=1 Tax=Copidosoma floridanum TaxID=29053 RepID=UPI0006C9D1D5|nr:zinc finger protein 184 [Copidosoma floridanum]